MGSVSVIPSPDTDEYPRVLTSDMIFHQLHNGTQNLNGALWCVFITSHEVVLRINANRQKE